jgi:rubrerythrin
VRLLHPAHIERDAHVNLSTTLDGDRGAAARARELATLAREAGLDREAALFETLAADELHHAAKLEAALRRLGTDAGAREATERRP